MKNLKTLFFALTGVLLLFGSGNAWGGTSTTIASWGKVQMEANKSVKASDGDKNNKSVATLTSPIALSQSGTNCYYASSWTSGNAIVIANLTTTGYSDIILSFYSRGSKTGTITITTSSNGGTSYSSLATQSITKSETQYTISTKVPAGTTNIKFAYGAAGSFYFGTVALSGTASTKTAV